MHILHKLTQKQHMRYYLLKLKNTMNWKMMFIFFLNFQEEEMIM